jgi:hypothetical protein
MTAQVRELYNGTVMKTLEEQHGTMLIMLCKLAPGVYL